MEYIKYRAWDKVDKKMRKIQSLHFNKEGIIDRIYLYSKKHPFLYFGYKISEFILMKFSGITDINEKDIYEGDIVLFKEDGCLMRAIIECDAEGWFCSEVKSGIGVFLTDAQRETKVEIIGNIYENPELLEVKNEY